MTLVNIFGRLHSIEKGNVVTGANEILDDAFGKKLDVINREHNDKIVALRIDVDSIVRIDSEDIDGIFDNLD